MEIRIQSPSALIIKQRLLHVIQLCKYDPIEFHHFFLNDWVEGNTKYRIQTNELISRRMLYDPNWNSRQT